MREIKFRAWDNVENKMIYLGEDNEYVFEIASYGIRSVKIGENPFEYEVLEHLKYLQYTGLKDKNGKEIYEGDIYKRYDSIFVVIFDELGFKYKKVYDSWLEKNVYNRNEISLLSKVDSDYCYEVIGNIYENPELVNP